MTSAHRLPAVVSAFLIAFAVLVAPGAAYATPSTPSPIGPEGIDVSARNGTLNWAALKASDNDLDFTYVQKLDGTTPDPSYDTNVNGAETVNVSAGAYAHARPDLTTPVAQADALVADDGSQVRTGLIPMVGLVRAAVGPACWGRSPASMVAWISAYVNEVIARSDLTPVIHTDAGFWDQCTGGSSAFDTLPLDIAYFGAGSEPALPTGWTHAESWQYTQNSRGLKGHDANKPLLGEADLHGVFGSEPTTPFSTGASLVTTPDGSLHVFAVNTEGAVVQGVHAPNHGWTWSTVTAPGVLDTPAVTYTAATGRFDLFAVGPDDRLRQSIGNGTSFGAWQIVPGGYFLLGGVSALRDRTGAYHVFSDTQPGWLTQAFYTGGHWTWQTLNAKESVAGTPGVDYDPTHNSYRFTAVDDGSLVSDTYPGRPASWSPLGGAHFAPGVSSVLGGGGVIHSFARTWAGVLYQTTGSGTFDNLGGTVVGTPAVRYTAGGNRYDLFAVGGNGEMYQKLFIGGRWSAWSAIGGSGLT